MPAAAAAGAKNERGMSTYAAISPARVQAASMANASVVLPDDAAPNSSVMRPRGMPFEPSAASKAAFPVGTPGSGAAPTRATAPCQRHSTRVRRSATDGLGIGQKYQKFGCC
jgi:hypothetical protein